jgi:hypothetical protein
MQLITAAAVVKSLPETVAIATESQAREVAKIEPAKRAAVVEAAAGKAASESRPMTAKDIKRAAMPEPEPDPAERPHVVSGVPIPLLGHNTLN